MGVPITVDSVREQIKEAFKLSISTVGTGLTIADAWTKYDSDQTKFPLFKVLYGLSNLLVQQIGRLDIFEDELNIWVAPLCTIDDCEIKTSKVIESFRMLFNIETVRALMHPNYQNRLQFIKINQAQLMQTETSNPAMVVQFKLIVRYSVQG